MSLSSIFESIDLYGGYTKGCEESNADLNEFHSGYFSNIAPAGIASYDVEALFASCLSKDRQLVLEKSWE